MRIEIDNDELCDNGSEKFLCVFSIMICILVRERSKE